MFQYEKIMPETSISSEYEEFFSVARRLAAQDVVAYPTYKESDLRDRFERHLLGMLEMYSVSQGDTKLSSAWIALKNYLMAGKNKEILDHMTFLETEFKIGDISEIIKEASLDKPPTDSL